MKKVLVCLFNLLIFGTLYSWGADVSPWTKGNVVITLSGTTLTLSPVPGTNGVMEDLTGDDTKDWRKSANRGNVQTIIIEDGVTHVGAYAFYQCLSITSITIPTSVTSFGTNAFSFTNSAKIVYYEGNPNEWANIDFPNAASHPFNGRNTYDTQFYFYNQKTTETTNIVFVAGLTTIKQYTFYDASKIADVHIPGTVTSIGTHALDCKVTRVYINKKAAPTTGDKAITWKTTADTYLYLRSDATNSYNTTPWYFPTSKSATGAYYLGYSSDHSSIHSSCSWKSTRYVSKVSGTMDNINWTLNEDGKLILTGNGTISKTYNTTYNSENVIPWFRFRYLVNKVVINADGGNITALSNVLNLSRWSLEKIEILQTTIPSGTYTITDEYKNSSDVVTVCVNPDLLMTAKSNAPWNNDRIKLALNDKIVIDDASDNTALLTALQDEVIEPFAVQLNRSFTNESYYTFCAPFAMTNDQLQAVFGSTYKLQDFTGAEVVGDELQLSFNEVTSLTAGKPYLIMPSSASVNNPTFEGMTITATEPSSSTSALVDFIGVLAPTELTGGNKNTLFLGAGNELFYPNATDNLKAFRAYFELKGDARRAVRARIRLGENGEQGLESVQHSDSKTQKIIRNGQLIIVRDGIEYNAQGMKL